MIYNEYLDFAVVFLMFLDIWHNNEIYDKADHLKHKQFSKSSWKNEFWIIAEFIDIP